MKNTLAKVSSSLVIFSGLATSAFASLFDGRDLIDQLEGDDRTLNQLIVDIINWVIGLAALVAVVMLIYAGYLYITANGDENKVSSATKTLTFAIVGLVVVFIAVLLVNFVLNSVLQV